VSLRNELVPTPSSRIALSTSVQRPSLSLALASFLHPSSSRGFFIRARACISVPRHTSVGTRRWRHLHLPQKKNTKKKNIKRQRFCCRVISLNTKKKTKKKNKRHLFSALRIYIFAHGIMASHFAAITYDEIEAAATARRKREKKKIGNGNFFLSSIKKEEICLFPTKTKTKRKKKTQRKTIKRNDRKKNFTTKR
jgi:hypothetical protein